MATEYHYHNLDTYAIETEYFSEAELMNQFSDLLSSYRAYHGRGGEVLPATDMDNLRTSAHVARQLFEAAFHNLVPDDHSLLHEEHETVIAQFVDWTKAKMPQDRGPSGVVRSGPYDVQGCTDQVMKLTSERNAEDNVVPWPLIKKVK